MPNVESRKGFEQHRCARTVVPALSGFFILHSAFCIRVARSHAGALGCRVTALGIVFALIFAPSLLAASRISVDRPTVRVGETFTVAITLEGAAAEVDRLPIPLSNLEFLGAPSVSRQFSMINGRFSRTKILQYTARPLAEGRAIVGPIRVTVGREQIEIQGAAVEVLAASAPGRETPSDVLRQMERERREPVFVTAQADLDTVVVGQQVVVTWTVWAREEMTDPSVIDLPELDGFWVEEIPVTEPMSNMVVDGDLLARAVVRRVALFPLRTGDLEVGPLEIRTGVYETARDPFGFGVPFRSGFVNVTRSSPPVSIKVNPAPAAADVIGAFTMRCTEPVSRGGGPVSFSISLEGEGNLRLAPVPRFEREPDAEIQVEPGELEVSRRDDGLRTERSWTMIVVPRAGREIVIPSLTLRAWNPESGRLEELRCDPGRATIEAVPAMAAPAPRRPPPPESADAEPSSRASLWPLLLAGALVVVGGGAWLLFARRRRTLRPQEERVLRHREQPRRMKEEVREMLREKAIDPALLYAAETPLADAWRALWSLLDVLEKEPWEKERSEDDLKRRVREFAARL
jgi:hypothetical protein